MKIYEINFTLDAPASFLIEARSKKEARELAETELDQMPAREWMQRIKDAVNYAGFKITSVTLEE